MESVPHIDIECMVYLFRSFLNKITILILNKQKTRKKKKKTWVGKAKTRKGKERECMYNRDSACLRDKEKKNETAL